MYTYRKLYITGTLTISTNFIQRIEDNAIIPCSTENRDYVEYLVWVAAGNTPLPAI